MCNVCVYVKYIDSGRDLIFKKDIFESVPFDILKLMSLLVRGILVQENHNFQKTLSDNYA